ncbi:M20 family metallopeptidase [Alloiococcus sp. CFN-8]|uniref:M20 family metallopeptidase n=1 Tax=Alloiococcus sp. CFN-8 TaxID=3416081 RepID=UPI003CEF6306
MLQSIKTAESMAQALSEVPERSFGEYRTTEIISQFLMERKIRIINLGMPTGVLAYLDAGRETTVALRADIDAVETDEGPKHLCGHNYHAAALLGAADMLKRMGDRLPCNVLFIFQPAEETTEGAKAMLEHGMMKLIPQLPVRLFGIHNRPEIPVGRIAVHSGPLMARKTNFILTYKGKTGHGGMPQLCRDPITAAAQFITSAQTVVSRSVDPCEAAVFSVCSIHAGTEDNLAPERVIMTGSARSLEDTVHEILLHRAECIAKATAEGMGVSWELKWLPQVPSVVNKEGITELARTAAVLTVGADNVTDTNPCLGSEDFAVFGDHISSFFYWVGSGKQDGTSASWHNPRFTVEPGYLDAAVPLLVNSVLVG